jgi:hypothetical protein
LSSCECRRNIGLEPGRCSADEFGNHASDCRGT